MKKMNNKIIIENDGLFIPYDRILIYKGFCEKCGAKINSNHYEGCKNEICPKCRKKFYDCKCSIIGFIYNNQIINIIDLDLRVMKKI